MPNIYQEADRNNERQRRHYIQKQTKQARLRQNGKLFMLLLSDMDSIKKLLEFIQRLYTSVIHQDEKALPQTLNA